MQVWGAVLTAPFPLVMTTAHSSTGGRSGEVRRYKRQSGQHS